MDKKLVKEFLIIIVVIEIACALINIAFNNIFVRIMSTIVSFSPSMASYISQKRNGTIANFKEWITKIFDIKHNKVLYLIILFAVIYCIIGLSFYIFIIMEILLIILVKSANEEVGLRMVIQPELEKSYNFHTSTICTAIIEWLWQISILFTKGIAYKNYFLLGITCLIFSYALATIKKVTNSIFPCIIAHFILDILFMIFILNSNILIYFISLIATIITSTIVLKINEKREVLE